MNEELIAEARAVLFQEHGEASEFSVFARLTTALEAAEARAVEAERECEEQARLNGMGAERELGLQRQLAAAREALADVEARTAANVVLHANAMVLQSICADCHQISGATLSDATAPVSEP